MSEKFLLTHYTEFVFYQPYPFPILGLLGGIFHFYSNLKETSVSSGEPDQTPCFAVSDLVFALSANVPHEGC